MQLVTKKCKRLSFLRFSWRTTIGLILMQTKLCVRQCELCTCLNAGPSLPYLASQQEWFWILIEAACTQPDSNTETFLHQFMHVSAPLAKYSYIKHLNTKRTKHTKLKGSCQKASESPNTPHCKTWTLTKDPKLWYVSGGATKKDWRFLEHTYKQCQGRVF